MPSDPFVLDLEDVVREVFAIHDVAVRGRDGRVVVFVGEFLRDPALVYRHVAPRLAERGMMALLRRERGRDVLVVQPGVRGSRRRVWVNAALLAVTTLSVLAAGTYQSLPAAAQETLAAAGDLPAFLAALASTMAAHWPLGVPFTAALLGILGVHELGHYVVGRHYGLDVSLPYFIPLPNMLTGTMGAVIRIESPFESRRALFDVGIAGPLAGMAVAVPVVILGLSQARVMPVDPASCPTIFGEPLLFQWLALAFAPPRPPGTDLEMNPLLLAGWWGFFVTALNLLPVSQLDGGHIAYAIFGRAHRWVARLAYAAALAVALVEAPTYLLLLGLVFLMRLDHPPALDDLTPIGPGRRALGLVTLASLLVLATPQPITSLCG